MKQQDPAHDITRGRAQPALRHLRLGRGVLRPDAGQPAGGRPERPRRRSSTRSTTGTTSRSTSAADKVALRRPRLLRHRPQAPAQHPAGSAARSWAWSWCSRPTCRRRRDYRRRRPGHRQRRPQQPHPHAVRRHLPARHRHCATAASSGSARTSSSTPSPSPSRRPSTAGSRRTPTSFDDDDLHLHRRDAGGGVAKAGLDTMEQEEAIAFCERLFAQVPRRPRADVQRRAPARLGAVDPLPARGLQAAGCTARTATRAGGADGRRRAHRALLDRLGHQARAGRRHRAGALHRPAPRRPAPRRCADYEAVRSVEVLQHPERRAQLDRVVRERRRATRNLPPEQFAYSLLTRSQRISHENLRLRDKALPRALRGLDRASAPALQRARRRRRRSRRCSRRSRVRGVTLKNRVVVSPMAQYSCVDGVPGDFHLVHLGARAHGRRRAGVRRDDLPVARRAHHAGLPGPVERRSSATRWKRIVDFVHANSRREDRDAARPRRRQGLDPRAVGRRATSRCDDGNWPLISASPQQYLDGVSDWSRAMTRADMDRVRDDFVRATRYAAEAGFDWLELHCAHGYLLSSFISPLTNQRTDEYGGSLDNRLRYPLEVFRAMRAAWPQHLPMSVRISAHDWVEGGITPDDAVRDRARLQGRRRRHDRLLVGPGQQEAEAGLRPHVPDAVRRPHPQRGRHRDHRGRRDLRGRPRQQHHRRRPRRPVRGRAAAPGQPGVDADWRRRKIGYHRPRLAEAVPAGKTQLERNLERERAAAAQAAGCRRSSRPTGRWACDERPIALVDWRIAKARPARQAPLRLRRSPLRGDCPAVLAAAKAAAELALQAGLRRRFGAQTVLAVPGSAEGNLRAAARLGAAEALRPPPGHAFANTTEPFAERLGPARRGGGGRLSARLCGAEERSVLEGRPRAARAGEDCWSSEGRRQAGLRASSAAAFETRAPQGSRPAAADRRSRSAGSLPPPPRRRSVTDAQRTQSTIVTRAPCAGTTHEAARRLPRAPAQRRPARPRGRAASGDHAVLKLWLRMLATHDADRGRGAAAPARAVRHLAGALRLPVAAVPLPAA